MVMNPRWPNWLLRTAAKAKQPARPGQPAPPAGLRTGDVPARARAYLRTVPPAIAHQKGHNQAFYAAGRLVRGFDLPPDVAYPILEEWNRTCQPPWSEAELRRKLREADKQPGPRGFLLNRPPPKPGGGSAGTGAQFHNYTLDEVQDGSTMRRVKRGRGGEELVEELAHHTGGWPRRVGRMLFAPDKHGQIVWMAKAAELFAWVDWRFRQGDGRGYDWAAGSEMLSPEAFLAACRQHCEPCEHVELYPHEPPLPGHYYHHPDVEPGDGSHLAELVDRFCPASAADDRLIWLMFVSMVWGGPAGKRPLFVVESDAAAPDGGTGSGKTTLARFAAALVNGYLSVSAGEQPRDTQTRLLSAEGLVRRVGLIDNLKSLRFSHADLEGLITAEVISGRQLFTGEGRRPNTLQWIVTANKPALSKDLAKRAVIIRVTTPLYDPHWQRDLLAYVEANRWKIIGDCIGVLRGPGEMPEGYRYTRWSEWEREVLAKAPSPALLAAEVFGRQEMLDDDREIGAEVADALRELLRAKGFDPDADRVLIPSQVLHEEVVRKFNSGSLSRVGGNRWLYTVGVAGLSKWSASLPYRGGLWEGGDQEAKQLIKLWGGGIHTTG